MPSIMPELHVSNLSHPVPWVLLLVTDYTDEETEAER